jgi:heptosyltransferase II
LPEQLKILIVQTAFIGDVVLTLPLAQMLRKKLPDAVIDFVAIPRTAKLLANHPAVNNIIVFDKRGDDRGLLGLIELALKLRKQSYDVALVPHRSLRSALLVWLGGCKKRIGFSKSVGKIFFTDRIPYPNNVHEIERNLTLLRPLAILRDKKEPPLVYPSGTDQEVVDKLLFDEEVLDTARLIGVAPGSVWNTKRWMMEGYVELVKKLIADGFIVSLIGGAEDFSLCDRIVSTVDAGGIFNAAGKLTLLQSCELLKRCKVLVSNDSAPIHLAAAVNTPVVAIFGATVPAFGFAPYSEGSVVVETHGLQCRPCAIHGGNECPIKTFDCMKRITADMVFEKVVEVYNKK